MRRILAFFLLLSVKPLAAQVYPQERTLDTVQVDSVAPVYDNKYREDQFYATFSYNIMQGKPGGYSQYSFSSGMTAGFLRDMPVNQRRTYAIAAGLGYSYNNIKHNLAVITINGANSYQIAEEGNFDKNKLVLHYLELPLELRWRNSDPVSHKFWRIHLGFKVSWLFYDKAQYEPNSATTIKVRHDKNLNEFVYSAYIAAGWNTWNLHASYGITPLYNSPAITGSDQKLKMNSLNLGLIFYIL